MSSIEPPPDRSDPVCEWDNFVAGAEDLRWSDDRSGLAAFLIAGADRFAADSERQFEIARRLRHIGQTDPATAIYRRLTENPDLYIRFRGLVSLAQCIEDQGDIPGAIDLLNQARSLDNRNPWPVGALVGIAVRQGDHATADKLASAYCALDRTSGALNVVLPLLGAKATEAFDRRRRESSWTPLAPSTVPALARAGLVMMIKNEVDIVGCNLDHHYALGFRTFCVLDNRSTDGTAEKIAAFRDTHPDCLVLSVFDPVFAYYQAQKMAIFAEVILAMARLEERELDWLFYIDADEFIAPTAVTGDTDPFVAMDNVLTNPENRALVFHWLHGVSTEVRATEAAGEDPFAVYSCWQRRLIPLVTKVALRPGLRPTQGNHSIDGDIPPYAGFVAPATLGWHIFHFPMRSVAQVRRKVINGAPANTGYKGLEHHAGHWKEYFAQYQRHGDGVFYNIISDFIRGFKA